MSVTELADRIPLSLSATSERLKRLIDTGVISGVHAQIDPALAGRSIEAMVDVRFTPGISPGYPPLDGPEFQAILDAVDLTGRFDIQLRVATKDVAELDELLRLLKENCGAEETNTRLILRTLDGFPRPLTPQ